MKNLRNFDYDLTKFISEKLLDHPWNIYMGFNEEEGVYIPQYIRLARSVVKTYFKTAEDMVNKVRKNLFSPELQDDINNYFQLVLATKDKFITASAIDRFRVQTQRTMNFLYDIRGADYNSIGIISTRQSFLNDPSLGIAYKYQSSIPDIDYLKTLSKAFIAKGDPFRRIFVLYDAIPDFDVRGVDAFGRPRNNMESVFLHELSHLSSDTKDFYTNHVDPTTFELGSAWTLRRLFQQHMDSGAFIYSKEFRDFIELFCRFHNIPSPGSDEEMLDILINSPMLQANIMMENADNFVAYVKDISQMKNNDDLKVKRPRKREKLSKTAKSISVGSKPGTSGTSRSNQLTKREISDAELELSEKLNAITFIS